MLAFLIASGAILLLFDLLTGLLLLLHQDPPSRSSPAVSVLIAAHNEKEKLEENLPSILEAMNEGDELILVDDGSDDGTYESLLERFPEAPLVIVRNYTRQGKKRAIDIGAQRATHSYILQTDADCRARSKEWIDRMRGTAAWGKEIGLGWGAIEGKGDFLDALIRYETARTALQYSSFALLRAPYMGVGRNLFYKRTLRTASRMPDSYYQSMSGDDDLFVAYRANGTRCTPITHPSSHTISASPSSWKAHCVRIRRHADAGRAYPIQTLIPLGVLRVAELLFPIFTLFLLFSSAWETALFIYLGTMILRGTITAASSKNLAPKHLILSTSVLAFISSMSRTFVEISLFVSKPARWR